MSSLFAKPFPDAPAYMAGLAQLPTSADGFTRIRWLRGAIRAYADDQAMLWLSGEAEPPEGEAELLLAAIRMAADANIPRQDAIMAARAEWKRAIAKVQAAGQEIRRAVYPLAREGAHGNEIMAAALVADRNTVFPTEVLTDIVRKIARAALEPRRVRG